MEDDPSFPNWKEQVCRHPSHAPPTMMFIPYGKRYRHVCPGCNETTFITSSQAWWMGSGNRGTGDAQAMLDKIAKGVSDEL